MTEHCCADKLVLIRARVHPFPSRTRKLSSLLLTILGWRRPGKISSANMKNTARKSGVLFVYRKPLAGRVVQKRLLPMRKNKTPSVMAWMRPGNCSCKAQEDHARMEWQNMSGDVHMCVQGAFRYRLLTGQGQLSLIFSILRG